MEEKIELFAAHEYEPQEINGRMAIYLRAGKDKRKKVEASRIPTILDALIHSVDVYIENAVIDGDMNMEKIMSGRYSANGRLDMRNSIIGGLFSFDRCAFQKEVYFSEIAFRKANFRNVLFQDKVTFYHVTFEGASFRYAEFRKATSFYNVTFGAVAFDETTFEEKVEFVKTKFGEGEANFIRANFKKRAAFIQSVFDIADFREARLEEPDFRGVTFGREARFGNAKVKYPADFSDVQFAENTVFKGIWNDAIRPICWWIMYNLPPCSVVFRMFERMMRKFLFSIKATSQIDMEYILDELKSFLESKNLPVLTSYSAQAKGSKCFIRDTDNGRKYISIRRRNCLYVYQQREHVYTDFLQLVEFTCNIWKKVREYRKPVTKFPKFNTVTLMDSSSNPHLKRYIDDEQWLESWCKNPNGRWWRLPIFWLWEITSHCGRSILLWAGWSVFFAVLFAFTYSDFFCDDIVFNVDQLADKQPDIWAYLYHSIVTFTTLGFGDIVPLTNPARLAVGAEVVLGYVMLGGLISIFANKFARRS